MDTVAWDKALEDRVIAARQGWLFKLPAEIRNMVAAECNSVSRDNLASLARVNSDCRQLARLWQFRHVRFAFNGDERTFQMIAVLHKEFLERQMNNGSCSKPSLGACIRQITCINHFSEGPIQPRFANIMPIILQIVSSLPNLRSFKISKLLLDRTNLVNLTSSKVTDLVLQYPTIDSIAVPWVDTTVTFPLKNLDITLDSLTTREPNYSDHISSIFRPCTTCLESLTITMRNVEHGDISNGTLPLSFNLEFSKLKFLNIRDCLLGDSAIHGLLKAPTLSTLLLDYKVHLMQPTGNSPVCLDHIPGLKTVIVSCRGGHDAIPENEPFAFLDNNKHISTLGLHFSAPPASIETIIPTLSSFEKLRRLSLVWAEATIPITAIQSIGCLYQVEKLHLTIGTQVLGEEDWVVSHDDMRAGLYGLRRLRKLYFMSDAYEYDMGEEDPAYEPNNLWGNRSEESMVESWALHVASMEEEAMEYAATFPALEYLMIGDIQFMISRDEEEIRLDYDDQRGGDGTTQDWAYWGSTFTDPI